MSFIFRRLFRQDFVMSTSVKNEVEDFPIINERKVLHRNNGFSVRIQEKAKPISKPSHYIYSLKNEIVTDYQMII